MSVNPLKIATGGYLKRNTKAVLVIAVAGYLNFGTPIGGQAAHQHVVVVIDDAGGRKATEAKLELQKKKKLIEQDEEEWMIFIQAFLKTL